MTQIHMGRGVMTDIELTGKLHDGTTVAYRFPGASQVEFDGEVSRPRETLLFGGNVTVRDPDEILAIDMVIRARRHSGLPHIMETRMVTEPTKPRLAKPDPQHYKRK